MSESKLLTLAEVGEIEARPARQYGTMVWLSVGERDALCSTVRHLMSQVDRGALCEECEQWEYNEDGSCRTFTVCGACWNRQSERVRHLVEENEKLKEELEDAYVQDCPACGAGAT